MLSKCFYLLAILTTVVSFTFSNVNFYPDGTTIALGSINLKVRNIAPLRLDWPSTNLSSTSDSLTFSLDNPLSATLTLQVFSIFLWVPAKLQLTLTGGATFQKNVTGACGWDGMTRTSCDAKAHVIIRGVLSNIQFADITLDVCEEAQSMLFSALAVPPQKELPAVAAGATDISRLLYFRKFTLANGLSQLLQMPMHNKFIAENAMQVSTGLVLPLFAKFDSADNVTAITIDIAMAITKVVKRLLNISTYNNETDATTTIEYQGGKVTMPTWQNLLNQITTRQGRAAIAAFVPAGASMVYDVVVNDLQCRFFNTVCSIPAENGIEVMNTRFTGFGDLNGVLDGALGAVIDATMTNITFSAIKMTSVLSRGRYYLSLI